MKYEYDILVDGVNMHYVRCGEGKKTFVVIAGVSLAGLYGAGESIAHGYSVFETEYTTFVFERKDILPEGYSADDMAEDLYKALSALGVEKCDILGVSQGGMIAQRIAINHPGFVSHLVLGSTLSENNEVMKHNAAEWKRLISENDVVGLNRAFFKNVYSEEYCNLNKEAFKAAEKFGTPEQLARFEVMADVCEKFDSYGEIEKIKCPVFVIGSERDAILTGNASRLIAEKLGCKIYMYEGYSHAVYDEALDYRKKVLEFFREG